MNNMDFKDLVLIIFNQTLGIRPRHNERSGLYEDLFPSYQLGRDIDKIEKNEPFPKPEIYVSALKRFFQSDTDMCIQKTTQLLELLMINKYIDHIEGPDILTKCDKNTLSLYQDLILDLWHHYYDQYSTNHIQPYRIPVDMINKIIDEYVKFRLPVTLEFYQQRIDDITELLQTNKANDLFKNIKTEYIHFFKNVLDNDSFYTLSQEETITFMNTLYSISDILDKMHHEDAYRINLEVLNFLNQIYDDNFKNVSIYDIRRIQGSIYGIMIENSNQSLQGNIKLSKNNNIVRIEDYKTPITQKEKMDMCLTALKNLLQNTHLNKLNSSLDEEIYITVYENRLLRKRSISEEEINALYVLSRIYANIATCYLQYIKYDLSTREDPVELCEEYHNKSGYVRNLIVRITKKMYGENSTQYNEALYFLADHYHSMATFYFYIHENSKTILIRMALYHFYTHIGLKEKAHMQLDLIPIDQHVDNNFDMIFTRYKKDFAYLSYTEPDSYEAVKNLISEYQIYKKFI